MYIQLAYVSEMRKDKLEVGRELQRPERGAVDVHYGLLCPSQQPPLQREPPKESFLFYFKIPATTRKKQPRAAAKCCSLLLKRCPRWAEPPRPWSCPARATVGDLCAHPSTGQQQTCPAQREGKINSTPKATWRCYWCPVGPRGQPHCSAT